MVNNTVNGEKIGVAAGKDKKFTVCSTAVQKGRQAKGINVTNNKGIETLINMFGKEDILKVTDTYIAIKAENGRNPKKSKSADRKEEGLSH